MALHPLIQDQDQESCFIISLVCHAQQLSWIAYSENQFVAGSTCNPFHSFGFCKQ
jgi:hypothetical protein